METSSTQYRRAAIVGLVVAIIAIGWWRLTPEAAPDVTSIAGLTMGTTFSVKYTSPGPNADELAASAVRAALDDVVKSMSTWEPDSEISRLNRAEAGVPHALSEAFAEVLGLAIEINSQTAGAFDPTVRPLIGAFGFGSNASEERPGEEELSAIRNRVGIELIEFDRKSMTMTKRIPDVELDFGGIAKGYGVDKVAEALERLGVTNYMVEVGGEIRVRGEKGKGAPWTLAIEEPLRDARHLHAVLKPSAAGGALATSGDYRSFRKVDGQIISHTFDPRSGEPVARRTASVSVIRPTAAEADALATALGVLSPEDALELANREGWAVYLLTHDRNGGFTPWKSRAFEKLDFREHRQ